MIDYPMAIMYQDVAATRQRWCMNDYDAYLVNMFHAGAECGHTSDAYRKFSEAAAHECVNSFIFWSDERYEYSKHAMVAMGITDEDQYFA